MSSTSDGSDSDSEGSVVRDKNGVVLIC